MGIELKFDCAGVDWTFVSETLRRVGMASRPPELLQKAFAASEVVVFAYADDFTMTTPMIQKLLGIPSGTLQGKRAVGDYWRAALQKIPDLQFSIIETTCGVDTVSIYYHAVLGRRAIETFFFDAAGKVCKALATYDA